METIKEHPARIPYYKEVQEMSELRRGNNLSELVLEKIQQSIQERRFRPGELLPSEKEMSEQYGVGKSSVREAIKMLQVLGVVESVQGKGTYLKESLGSPVLMPLLYELMLQKSTAEEMYEFRLMFDMAYMRIATLKATEEDKTLAQKRFFEYLSCYKANISTTEADLSFHKAMLNATKNQFIINIGTLIMELCNPYFSDSSHAVSDEVMSFHEDMLKAFCSGDTGKAMEDAVIGCMKQFKLSLDHIYQTDNKHDTKNTDE